MPSPTRLSAAQAGDRDTKSVASSVYPADAEAFCLVVSGTSGVATVPLSGRDSFVLGRAAECDVVIADDSVSRKHAILRIGQRMVIRDLGSSNGTRVDDRRLQPGEEAGVRVGTVFELGKTAIILQRARWLAGGPASRDTVPPGAAAQPPSGAPLVRDQAMHRLYALLDVIGPSPLSVLILGETGVGKEVFAESVHKRSARALAPFLQLNCAALPESLLEGELFGYEKGAFTGATQAKAGLFESADGGTVFIDEVGEIPMATQAKLLRVLENGHVMRLGALKPKTVDVRFVSATNRDLRALIAEGRFRADLYFRLNGVSMTLPPLRQRVAEIVPLAQMFAERAAARTKRAAPVMTKEAEGVLEAYDWPGNVRELRSVIERAVVVGGGEKIDATDLGLADAPFVPEPVSGRLVSVSAPPPPSARPSSPRFPGAGESLRAEVEALEKERIVDALAKTGGNQSQAAKLLGISRRNMITRIERYGIVRPRKRGDVE
jgi:DNA-binding NtrC family response regulator